MIPGKTYVGILPGHTRPAFVRKRPVDAGRPPLLLTQIFGSSRRAYSVEAPRKASMFCRPRSDVYYDYATAKYRPKVYVDHSPGRSITSVQQTCASCGKFRSARWQSRHPLIPGRESAPGLCGKCRDKHTSSEEERPSRRRGRRHHHRHRDHRDTTDDSYNTSRESRPTRRRRRSYSRDYRRRSPVRSRSREKVRIIIANHAGDRRSAARERTRSSSMEPVRVIHRTEVVDPPERPPRTRYISRSSGDTEYINMATQYIEDLDPPRYLPRSRTLSRVSFTEGVEQVRYRSKPRSLSHVSYVEERPRHRSRPRSISRVSYIEDAHRPRSRRRARSSSQVRFVDETDYSVSPPKPRRLKRRRVVYFDGPVDTEESEQQTLSHTSKHHSSQGGASDDGDGDSDGDGDAVHSKDVNTTPRSRAPGSENVRGAEEPQFTPHDRPNSLSRQGLNPSLVTVSDRSYRPPSETRSHASESDHEATPRPAFRHVQIIQSPDDVEEPPSHYRSSIDLEGARADERFPSATLESRKPNGQRLVSENPYRRRRERFRDSDESSDPDEDDYPRPSPIVYRHVEAPEHPTPDADLLLEMLQNATITPPSAQYARGSPAQRYYYSESDIPSQSHPRRSYAGEASENRHVTGEKSCDDPLPHEPNFRSNAEYNWMT